jgi:hypothetical protein
MQNKVADVAARSRFRVGFRDARSAPVTGRRLAAKKTASCLEPRSVATAKAAMMAEPSHTYRLLSSPRTEGQTRCTKVAGRNIALARNNASGEVIWLCAPENTFLSLMGRPGHTADAGAI